MRRTDFHYDLPAELIAQRPTTPRSASRLLALDGAHGTWQDLRVPRFSVAAVALRICWCSTTPA